MKKYHLLRPTTVKGNGISGYHVLGPIPHNVSEAVGILLMVNEGAIGENRSWAA